MRRGARQVMRMWPDFAKATSWHAAEVGGVDLDGDGEGGD